VAESYSLSQAQKQETELLLKIQQQELFMKGLKLLLTDQANTELFKTEM